MSKKVILIGTVGAGQQHILDSLKRIHGNDSVVVLSPEEFKRKSEAGEITDELVNPPITDQPFVLKAGPAFATPYIETKEKRSWSKNNRKK